MANVNSDKKCITSRGLEQPTFMHDCILVDVRSVKDSLLLGFSWQKASRVDNAFPIFGKTQDARRGVLMS